MKIKIDEKGFLSIERAGELHAQLCPLDQSHPYPSQCGDWCPLFGEPVHDVSIVDFSGVEVDNGWSLAICQGRVLVGEVIDERKGK